MPYTVVSFHAHPDDEVLLTGGTLARAAAEGHRVVLVTATAGEAGLAGPGCGGGTALAAKRQSELERSATVLGCARVEILGYADSGMYGGNPAADAFSRVVVEPAAERLAALLRQERADVLTAYDAHGGYGHPDHVAVHRVGLRAAELAGTPVVLEATVDRLRLQRALRLVHRVPRAPDGFRPERFADAFADPSEITHVIDVRRHLDAKRRAMAAHASQSTGGDTIRTLTLLLRLPAPVFRHVLGREWFIEPGRTAGKPIDDIFATLRPVTGAERRE